MTNTERSGLDLTHRFEPGDPEGDPEGAGVTLLLLHGTGGDEDTLVPLARYLAPRANLLSPRGKVSENGVLRFFRRHAPGVLDVKDLKARTHELASLVEEAAALHGFDAGKVVAVGYSNGANIAASLLLLRPEVLAGALLLRPMTPFEPEVLPDLPGTPVFVAAGRVDSMVPASEPERLAELLKAAGAEVELRWQRGGHTLVREELEDVREWLSHETASLKSGN